MTTHAEGYAETHKQLTTRLRRAAGQVRGIERMVEEDRYCIDVITQISAVQAALDKVALGLLGDHARRCASSEGAGGAEERSDEIVAAVARLLRRG